MVTVEIEYCVPCGLLDPAIETQRNLLRSFGRDLDAVRLVTGHGGVFRVSVEGETVWDAENHEGRIDNERIAERVEDRLQA
jgi:selenoprotein W-related protein